jgi:putative hydrolase of the HAD superfamily
MGRFPDGTEAMNNIRGVTLDVGGTLIEPWPSVGQIYARAAADHGCADLPVDLLNRRFKEAWKSSNDFDYTREGWERLVHLTFGELITKSDLNAFFPKLYDQFARRNAWHLFEDVVPTLEGLASGGVCLGIISNWDERLRPLLDDLRLRKYFKSIVVSCEAGATKPSAAIFKRAAAEMDLPAASLLHVGDSLEMDVEWAIAAGFMWETVWKWMWKGPLRLVSSPCICGGTARARVRSRLVLWQKFRGASVSISSVKAFSPAANTRFCTIDAATVRSLDCVLRSALRSVPNESDHKHRWLVPGQEIHHGCFRLCTFFVRDRPFGGQPPDLPRA